MGQPLLFSMNAWPVFSQNQRDIENNSEKDESGNDENNYNDDDDEDMSDSVVDKLVAELSPILTRNNGNGKKLTPHICRNECKNYYGVTDANDGQFRELCWKKGETYKTIYEGHDCKCVESKKPKLPEGILEI